MTWEEAIKWMEKAIQDTNTYWDSCSEALQKELNEQNEVFLLAIDAMLHADRKQKLEAENMKLRERIINWRKYTAPTREQVEKWRGEWEWYDEEIGSPLEGVEREWGWRCSKCKTVLPDDFDDPDNPPSMRFCPWCGAPMTAKAVDIIMARWEALYEEG